ncbi:putative nuclease HARBI1, partial [Stegodyphus mimosarum]
MEILDVVARWPGSTHDSFMWKRSKLRELFVSGQIPRQNFLLGDSGYPLEPWLLTPYSSPNTHAQQIFNRKHKSLRAVVEHCNGLLKSRFRCLHESGGVLLYTPIKTCKIILACTVLHNICIQRNIPWDNYEVEEDTVQPVNNDNSNNAWRREALLIRDEIAANMSR